MGFRFARVEIHTVVEDVEYLLVGVRVFDLNRDSCYSFVKELIKGRARFRDNGAQMQVGASLDQSDDACDHEPWIEEDNEDTSANGILQGAGALGGIKHLGNQAF